MTERSPDHRLGTAVLEQALDKVCSICECSELPPHVWQRIYRHLDRQNEVCSGRQVCKLFKAVLPELLSSATLSKPASLTCLPGIQADFSSLVLLELRVHLFGDDTLPPNVHVTPPTLPSLRELRAANSIIHLLVFDNAHFPQLRNLIVESRPWGFSTKLQLQLNLPLLLTLEIGGGVFSGGVSELAACLSPSACPRLHRFCGAFLTLGPSTLHTELTLDLPWPQHFKLHTALTLDMPWLQHFELHTTGLDSLKLRAPKLLGLCLLTCPELTSVTLLPDGDATPGDSAADAADAAVVVPVSMQQKRVEENSWRRDAGVFYEVSKRSCVPCGNRRVNLTYNKVKKWECSESFTALCKDPRMHEVFERDGYRAWIFFEQGV